MKRSSSIPRRHPPYLDLADERDYRIAQVVDTHLHADHLSGNRVLAAATGARSTCTSRADVHFPFEPLRDGEELHLGQVYCMSFTRPATGPRRCHCW